MDLQKLKNNQMIDYLYICASHVMSSSKRQFIIDSYRSDRYIRMEYLGDKNPDKVIYMIDPSNSYTSGFFSNMSMILFKTYYAHENGMYAVVYKGNPSHYNEPVDFLGTNNYFDYFFEQPDGINLTEALDSQHVVWNAPKQVLRYYHQAKEKQEKIFLHELETSLHIKNYVLDELEKSRQTFIGDKKVLGVKYRGTDYANKYKGHPVLVTVRETIEHIKKMYEKGFDKIYLATEDMQALDEFKKYFGNELCYDESIKRADKGQRHIDLAISSPESHSAYQEGLNVLKDVWVLSHADSFIGTQCGVTRFVPVFNKAYKAKPFSEIDIIDKKVYRRGKNSIKEGKRKYGK